MAVVAMETLPTIADILTVYTDDELLDLYRKIIDAMHTLTTVLPNTASNIDYYVRVRDEVSTELQQRHQP